MIFIDTSAWIALEDRKDINHQKALEIKNELFISRSRLITTNYILDETYTLMLLNVGYRKTVEFKYKLDEFIKNNLVIVYYITSEIEHIAWKIFEDFNKDKTWSFTDCASKVIIEKVGLREIFTFDHHFEQMGFKVLLK
ncbi:MAG: PIN domain-containing protein [Candidatus Firestonebacteria bacterium]|nr:PIN domain-containing protein [Candidatus Firestonebacteria bacterium]